MQLHLDASGKELKSHGSFEFPVFVSDEQLSFYEQNSFAWHYHSEPELTLVLQGSMIYQVNQQSYELHAGQGLFCNSNALHTGHPVPGGGDCKYLSVTFAPRLLAGFSHSIIQKQYIHPLLASTSLTSRSLLPDGDWQDRILDSLTRIRTLDHKKADGYEIRLLTEILSIWSEIYEHCFQREEVPSQAAIRDAARLRTILDYIHLHYMEHITLEDIAAQISICRSECCRFFKKHMHESLFDYLLEYRIRQSLSLLSDSMLSITEIADQTGFTTPAYYAKVFRQQIHMTPGEYRRQNRR